MDQNEKEKKLIARKRNVNVVIATTQRSRVGFVDAQRMAVPYLHQCRLG